MKLVNPNVATSLETSNSFVICGYVIVYIDEVHVLIQNTISHNPFP